MGSQHYFDVLAYSLIKYSLFKLIQDLLGQYFRDLKRLILVYKGSCTKDASLPWLKQYCIVASTWITTSLADDIWGSEQSLRIVCESITEKDSSVIFTGFWLDSKVIWNLGLIHARDSALVMKQFSERISPPRTCEVSLCSSKQPWWTSLWE